IGLIFDTIVSSNSYINNSEILKGINTNSALYQFSAAACGAFILAPSIWWAVHTGYNGFFQVAENEFVRNKQGMFLEKGAYYKNRHWEELINHRFNASGEIFDSISGISFDC